MQVDPNIFLNIPYNYYDKGTWNERHNTKWKKKMHNESAQSPRKQYFNSLSAATKTCLSGFLLNIDRPREKVFFFPLCREKVIVAMLKIICYQCRLIVASRLEFWASIRWISILYVTIENDQIESDQASRDYIKEKFAIWYMEHWSTMVSSEIFDSLVPNLISELHVAFQR